MNKIFVRPSTTPQPKIAAPGAALALVHIKKDFDHFEVIKDISLSASENEFICLIGPSGCGKTVLLSMIAGFIPPTHGTIEMHGVPVTTISPDRIMVFQDHMLFPWKTVAENIAFGLSRFMLTKSEKKKRVDHYAQLVGMATFQDWPIHKLSGGMKQRTAFARALAADPQILLMDEPFSALDSFSRKKLRGNLIDIWQKAKKTIIFVTHSIHEAIQLGDKIYVLSARPVVIKKMYDVTMPRPRDGGDPRFVHVAKDIERNIMSEVEASLSPENYQANDINLRETVYTTL